MPREYTAEEIAECLSWCEAETIDILEGSWAGVMWGRHEEHFPTSQSMHWFLGRLNFLELCDAMEITAKALPEARGKRLVLYFYGVCHGMIRQKRSAL